MQLVLSEFSSAPHLVRLLFGSWSIEVCESVCEPVCESVCESSKPPVTDTGRIVGSSHEKVYVAVCCCELQCEEVDICESPRGVRPAGVDIECKGQHGPNEVESRAPVDPHT